MNKDATSLKWEGDQKLLLTFKIGDQKVDFENRGTKSSEISK
jgi:hypothetical protein